VVVTHSRNQAPVAAQLTRARCEEADGAAHEHEDRRRSDNGGCRQRPERWTHRAKGDDGDPEALYRDPQLRTAVAFRARLGPASRKPLQE
jgi:hypothetical protein